jgi:hypothetical protein
VYARLREEGCALHRRQCMHACLLACVRRPNETRSWLVTCDLVSRSSRLCQQKNRRQTNKRSVRPAPGDAFGLLPNSTRILIIDVNPKTCCVHDLSSLEISR